jgi:hypothetical protein
VLTFLTQSVRICTKTYNLWRGGLCCCAILQAHSCVSIASLCRLESKGIEVLVERRIAREFPQYRVFDPCRNGECGSAETSIRHVRPTQASTATAASAATTPPAQLMA